MERAALFVPHTTYCYRDPRYFRFFAALRAVFFLAPPFLAVFLVAFFFAAFFFAAIDVLQYWSLAAGRSPGGPAAVCAGETRRTRLHGLAEAREAERVTCIHRRRHRIARRDDLICGEPCIAATRVEALTIDVRIAARLIDRNP